ncbi:MAG: M28 family peptidase [Gemmatimonadaceae bacterium]|nr:M28 family peptidase [Gemmatimonadaceae bacterium]MDQ3243191.1 M28 family peptidase [Gemmatimonadota bacterium]
MESQLKRRHYLIPAGFILSSLLLASSPAADPPLLGFSMQSSTTQRALEQRFDALLRKDNLRNWMKQLSARPHHVGSAYGKQNAEFIAAQFRAWGYDTKIERFDVLFPTPTTRVLELVSPGRYTAKLAEPVLSEDATSGQSTEQLPIYNAYSGDGDVTAELVYVNYGIPRDYEDLEERGIDVRGKIVIARYGGSWRGIKPKVAAEHGAIGCIIYSDPRDDGYFQGDVYPVGAWRNEMGAQRGSVADMPTYPGDPLTPGVGATKNARRLARKDAPTLMKIPVLPISYGDALPLLRAIGGPVAPASWRGSLPITYHIGPGPARVHLKLAFYWALVPAYDVLATLRGSERPDEWIIRGNHHDAWVNGADDPISGMVSVMEEARAIGELAKTGWRPKRTIVFAAWDAEEPGLLGSTEWAEAHADVLRRNGAVYVNSDSNGRGFLFMAGSHTLERFINEVARDVTDPQKKISVLERARAGTRANTSGEAEREAKSRRDLRISALGSGSDYTPFLQHLGIASLNIGFGGEDGGGSYHSIYDSFDHYSRFGDPGFDYGIALAQTGGRVVLRLANADVLPFSFNPFTETVGRYLKEVTKLSDDMREETASRNARIQDRVYELASDPKERYVAPKGREPVPFLNFAPLQNALARLENSGRAYDSTYTAAMTAGRMPTGNKARVLDATLIRTERAMTRPQGLPRRSWFKHQIYAPGFYTGYGVKTLPAVREAIEQRDWKEAAEQIVIVSRVLEGVSAEIDRATQSLK